MRRTPFVLLATLALASLAAPAAARANTAPGSGWSFTLSAWAGASRYDVLGLEHGVANVGAADGKTLLDGSFDVKGGAGVLRLGWLELGLLYEGTLLDTRADSEVFTPVAGFKVDLTDVIRLEVLGELGGHRLGHIGTGLEGVTDTQTVWLPYVGVRPSVAFRLPVSALRLVLSVTPFARWDLVKRQVEVQTSTGGTTSRTYYEAGGSTFGVVGAVGIEI
ncbi:MAG TPA: hypothetical protein VF894_09395 [Anaeromyxobacter sp.]